MKTTSAMTARLMAMMFLQFFIWAAGWIFNAIMPSTGGAASLDQWQLFWMFPLIFALVGTALFMIGFRDEVPTRSAITVH